MGLEFKFVGVVIALADLRVERQRVARHGSTFDAGLPARTVDVRCWLKRPVGPLRGLWFLQISRPVGAIRQPTGHERVRRTRRSPDRHPRPPTSVRSAQSPSRMGSEMIGAGSEPAARGQPMAKARTSPE
jgi:hypothetical protein